MSNYVPTGAPPAQTRGISSSVRSEFLLIAAGIASKANTAGQTYSGAHDFTAGSVFIPTLPYGSSGTGAVSADYLNLALSTSTSFAAVPVWVSGSTYAQYFPVLSPTDFRVYRRRTAAAVSTIDPSLDPANWGAVLPPLPPYLHAREIQISGGTAIATSPNNSQPRNLNGTVGGITIPGAALTSGNVSLPAGIYEFSADATFYAQQTSLVSRLFLYNLTDAVDMIVGPNGGGNASMSNVSVRGRFTLTSTKVISLRQWFGSLTGSAAGGQPISNGQVEVYASIKIEMIG